MNTGAGIGFFNTGLPLAALAVAATVLPVWAVPRATRSQARLAGGMVMTAGLTFLGALGLFAALHAGAGNAVRLGGVAHAAGLSALAWGPLWALAWLVRAQGVEKRRGQDLARRG